jgi:hypothetical protein
MKKILFLSAMILLALQSAGASMLETFTFTQAGYSAASLSGSFTGLVEADGIVQLADLTSFTANLTTNLGFPIGAQTDTYALGDLKLFSISVAPDGPNSSLDLFASITTGTPGNLCVGAAAAFDLCGTSNNAVGFAQVRYAPNPFLTVKTSQTAVVNLVPAAPVTTVPEPASPVMIAIALALGMAWQRRRKCGFWLWASCCKSPKTT